MPNEQNALMRLRGLVEERHKGWCDPDVRFDVPPGEKFVRAAECRELLALIDHCKSGER